MINQKESIQVGTDSWLLRPLSQDMKTKAKDIHQPKSNHK